MWVCKDDLLGSRTGKNRFSQLTVLYIKVQSHMICRAKKEKWTRLRLTFTRMRVFFCFNHFPFKLCPAKTLLTSYTITIMQLRKYCWFVQLNKKVSHIPILTTQILISWMSGSCQVVSNLLHLLCFKFFGFNIDSMCQKDDRLYMV